MRIGKSLVRLLSPKTAGPASIETGLKINKNVSLYNSLTGLLERKSRDRKADNEARIEQALAYETTRGLADYARSKYEKGELSEGQQAQVDQFKNKQGQALKKALYDKGISDSSVAVDEAGRVDIAAVGMKDKLIDEEFTKYMTALGLTDEAAGVIRNMNTDDRQQAIQIFQTFSSMLGNAYGNSSNNDKVGTDPKAGENKEGVEKGYGLEYGDGNGN